MKYQVGDMVVIRSDLDENRRYYMDDRSESNTVTHKMVAIGGTVHEITDIYGGQYRIADDNGSWLWTDEMFDGFAIEPEDENEFNDEMFEEILIGGVVHEK